MRWATRSHCQSDRAACAWLVRRFIDPEAEYVFVDDPSEVPPDATPFDMRGVELSHHGGDCSFETFLRRYELADPVLWEIPKVVHEADPVSPTPGKLPVRGRWAFEPKLGWDRPRLGASPDRASIGSGIVTLEVRRSPVTKISGTTYSGDGTRRKGRVYILEPDSSVRKFLARVATHLGYAAHKYDHAAAAEITEADVLVVEPFDGASLTAAVELQARLPGVRIICVSDSISLTPAANALKPHAYVVKPFKLEELERALRAAFWN